MRDFLFSYILGIAIYNRDTLSLVEATESDSGLNMGYTPYLSRYYPRPSTAEEKMVVLRR